MTFDLELIDFVPNLHPLILIELRMINSQRISEIFFYAAYNLRGEGYFRKKVEHLFSLFQSFFNEADIYLRLSAARHAMKQNNFFLFPFLFYFFQNSLLDRKSTRLNSSHANISYA